MFEIPSYSQVLVELSDSEQSACAQFEAIKSVFISAKNWTDEDYNYLVDFTSYKIGEDNKGALHSCFTLEDEARLNLISDDEIFNLLVAPESSSEKSSVSSAPFQTISERRLPIPRSSQTLSNFKLETAS